MSLHQLLYELRRTTNIVHVETEINLAVKPAECLAKIGMPSSAEGDFLHWLKMMGIPADMVVYEYPARNWVRFYIPVAIEGE